jgi:pimeloyl-ACP methyl ester carboxylesterase
MLPSFSVYYEPMIGTEQTHQIDGIPVAVVSQIGEKSATAPATIFLHGWGGNAQSFQTLWEALNTQRAAFSEVIAIDLPGFGHTPPPPTPWDLDDYIACVVKYLDLRKFEKIDIVSHSFGGRLTTKLLSLHPQRVRKAVYIAPAGILHHERKTSLIQAVAKPVKMFLQLPGLRSVFPTIRRFGYRLIGNQDYLKTSGVMRETFQKVIAEDTAPLLPSITQPVKIFWGRNDGYVPVGDGDTMQRTIPDAELTIYEDGRHGIHLTHARPIAEQIAQFLYA